MVTLLFKGTRRRDFTVVGPVTATEYFVNLDPEHVGSGAIEVDSADAKALLERDPDLWERAKVTPPAKEKPDGKE